MTQTQVAPGTDPVPYKTSDTPYAAYLHFSGHRLMGSLQDPNDYKREVVFFIHSPEIDELEDLWRVGKAVGDLKRYHRSLKIVNRFVNEARRKREE